MQRGHAGSQDVATCGVHETDAVERTVLLCLDWSLVQRERDPGLVDLELLRMEPRHFVKPRWQAQPRRIARSAKREGPTRRASAPQAGPSAGAQGWTT